MESVESRAKEALEAYLKCNETVKSVYYKKICDHDCDNCNLNYAQGTYGDHKEAVKTAIQALEKQIPMKPTPIDYEKYIDVIDNAKFLKGAFWCPNCKHVVHSGSFCKDCGQKLDWSDEE
nr:MAG TPA: hydrogenase/urease nickel incorporation protein [Caudoviricetes sp.]